MDAALLGVARPKFLLLPPICVGLGVSVAWAEGAAIDSLSVVIALLGALSAHVAVNALNEHADFVSGLDLKAERTPFSGGSGTLVGRPDLVSSARLLGMVSLLITVLSGLWLVQRIGWGLLPFGLLGIGVVLAYIGPLMRHRWWVLVSPGLGFGPLMVLGSYYVATGTVSTGAVLASLVVFFLVNNLLLLNQFPDREVDSEFGRDNLVIHDLALASRVYGLSWLLAGGTLAGLSLLYPPAALGLLPLLLGFSCWRAARDFRGEVSELIPAMGMNVLVALGVPLVLALALTVSKFLEA